MLSHRNIVEHTKNAVPLAPLGRATATWSHAAVPRRRHLHMRCSASIRAPSTFTVTDPARCWRRSPPGPPTRSGTAVVSGLLVRRREGDHRAERLKYLLYGAAPMPLPMLRQALAAWPGLNFVQSTARPNWPA